MAADVRYTRCSQHVLLSLSRIVRNTHIVCAESYDREVVAVVQFHSWYHLDALHATPRHATLTTTAVRLPADGELQTENARSHSACSRSLTTTGGPTQLQDQIVCASFSLSVLLRFLI